jgi:hypothetical protein
MARPCNPVACAQHDELAVFPDRLSVFLEYEPGVLSGRTVPKFIVGKKDVVVVG